MSAARHSPRLTVLSSRGDHHGAVVAEALRRQRGGDLDIRIVEMDAMAVQGGIRWEMDDGGARLALKDGLGRWFDPAQSDVIWCRRFSRPQQGGDGGDMATIQWRQAGKIIAALNGPVWRDHPDAIIAAESKPAQLAAAAVAGLHVPRTLVSQDAAAIRAFHAACDGRVIVKPVKGHIGRQLFTVPLAAEALADDAALAQFPAIYQQMIAGADHLRLVVLPSAAQGFAIRSPELDWRRRRDLRIAACRTDAALVARCRDVLARLGLSMGVFDFKYDRQGRPWFLEVNPQGQFFFLEALGRVDLASLYAADLGAHLPSAAIQRSA